MNPNVERYMEMVSELFRRRVEQGPLPDEEEAEIAEKHAEIWSTLSEEEQESMIDWIEEQKKKYPI